MADDRQFTLKLGEDSLALTFDDVLLLPGRSKVEPSAVGTVTRITERVTCTIPIISAAMDTVTEANMAIAMAQAGGLGVIHKNMPVKIQAEMVQRAKRHESFIIRDVFTIPPDLSAGEAKRIMDERGITGIPVVDDDDRLIGILTLRDLRFIDEPSLSVSELMSKAVVTVDDEISMEGARKLLQEHRIEKLPIIDEERRVTGLITVKDLEKRTEHAHATRDEDGHLVVGAAVGPFDKARAKALDRAGADIIFIDCAHAHNMNVVSSFKKIKKELGCEVVIGNIATAEAAEDLIAAGARTLKVGIGAGSICTTRVVAGIGVPQLQAIAAVADVAAENDAFVIADGGIRYSGDIAKALAAGADTVMLGNMLAGTKESPGDEVIIGGRRFKRYRGMGSLGAMKVSADRYFQDSSVSSKLVPEGVEGAVPFRGPVSDVIFQQMGGVKSAMGYVGAATIEEMKAVSRFIRISPHGKTESHPHDILITNEAPNYFTTDSVRHA